MTFPSFLALKANGTVVAWNKSGQLIAVPPDLVGVVAIAAGAGHSLALKSNGTVVAWGGGNQYNEATVPAGLNDVTAIAAGTSHSVALRQDGTIVAWGRNHPGAVTGTPTLGNAGIIAFPVRLGGSVLNGIAAIAAGNYHTVALRKNGTVTAWGSNFEHQTEVTGGLYEQPGVIAVAAGFAHMVALEHDGTIRAYGSTSESFGYAAVVPGDLDRVASSVPMFSPSGLNGVIAIASAGEHHIVALKSDGTVVAWGRSCDAVPPAGLREVTAIGAGAHMAFAILDAAPNFAPNITTQPATQTANVGQSANFYVTVFGPGPFTYQWRKDGVNIAGATNSTYAIGAV